MYEALTEMLDAGVEPTEARRLLQTAAEQLSGDQLSDPWLVHGRICQFVGKNLRIADPISVRPTEQSVVAFVGPTGVGKTTTLAKLAATFQHEHKCRVGLLTLDTMRPGAVDQLLQYAESLDAALEVVDTPSQFLPAIARMKNCDIVLVDTAGRSPNDDQQLAVLHDLLEAAQPTSVQLVVSATNSVAHVKATLNKFGSLNPNGLVITKLDEAIGSDHGCPCCSNARFRSATWAMVNMSLTTWHQPTVDASQACYSAPAVPPPTDPRECEAHGSARLPPSSSSSSSSSLLPLSTFPSPTQLNRRVGLDTENARSQNRA